MNFQKKKNYVFETGVDYNVWNLYHTKITTTESYSSLILEQNCQDYTVFFKFNISWQLRN